MHGCSRGVYVVAPGGGGMRGFIWGVCMVLFGGAWFYLGGVRGFIREGMCGFIWGACMVLFGGHVWFCSGGHAWFFQFFWIQSDKVNERAVHILLECILVTLKSSFSQAASMLEQMLHCLIDRSLCFCLMQCKNYKCRLISAFISQAPITGGVQ